MSADDVWVCILSTLQVRCSYQSMKISIQMMNRTMHVLQPLLLPCRISVRAPVRVLHSPACARPAGRR